MRDRGISLTQALQDCRPSSEYRIVAIGWQAVHLGRDVQDVQKSSDPAVKYGVDPSVHWFAACNGEVGRWLSPWEVNPLDQSLSDPQYISARARALEEKYHLPDSLIHGLSDRWTPQMDAMPLSFGTITTQTMELIANRVKALDNRTLSPER